MPRKKKEAPEANAKQKIAYYKAIQHLAPGQFILVPYLARYMLLFFLLIISIFMIWSATHIIQIGVKATGLIEPIQPVHHMQHLEGGILKKIWVKNGQEVKKGDLLIELDENRIQGIVNQQEEQTLRLQFLIARLESQIAQHKLLHAPEDLKNRYPKLFEASQVQMHHAQEKYEDELRTYKKELVFYQKELLDIAPLVEKKVLAPIKLKKVEQKINLVKGKIEKIENEYNLKLHDDLSKSKHDLIIMEEKLSTSRDQLKRTKITSPIEGIVNNINYLDPGVVVPSGETIMDIIPNNMHLRVRLDVPPEKIAFIEPNSSVIIRVNAYDYSIYGSLRSTVEHITPSTVLPSANDNSLISRKRYIINSTLKEPYLLWKGKELPLYPGMTVQATILTHETSLLMYFFKPIVKSFSQHALSR